MSLMPTAPRSIGGVLDNAIRLYRAVLPRCIPLLLAAVVVLAVVGGLVAYKLLAVRQFAAGDPMAALRIFTLPAIWGGYFAIMVITVFVYNVLFVSADAVARGASPTLFGALGAALRRWVPSIVVGILFMLIIGIASMFLLLPGIWLWGVFQFAFVAVVVDKTGVFASLGTSRRLVKGNWWRTSTIMFVGFVIMYVLLLVVAFAISLLTVSLHLSLLTRVLFQQCLSAVLNLFLLPFIPSLMLSIYYDLKLRNEGSDLEARLQALQATS